MRHPCETYRKSAHAVVLSSTKQNPLSWAPFLSSFPVINHSFASSYPVLSFFFFVSFPFCLLIATEKLVAPLLHSLVFSLIPVVCSQGSTSPAVPCVPHVGPCPCRATADIETSLLSLPLPQKSISWRTPLPNLCTQAKLQ